MSAKPADTTRPIGITRPSRGLASILWDAEPDTPWTEIAERWERRKQAGDPLTSDEQLRDPSRGGRA